MRPTLLLLLSLFLTACSNDTEKKQPTAAEAAGTEIAAPEQQPAAAPEPEKNITAAVETPSAPAAEQVDEEPVNGHAIFVHKCVSCHGKNGEKLALNVSEAISGWEAERTVSALKGYRNGTYGKNLKGIMKGQVSSLSDKQIEAVAGYIATL